MARRGRSSFTAVEVLLIIGVVGVLATVLLPVFAHERDRARQAVCLANIRTIAQALRIYVADNDRHFPPREGNRQVLAYFNTHPGGGGKDSNGQPDGGDSSYEGYGIDCSGLVSCAADGGGRAGYNWDYPPPGGDITWRVGTWGLAGDYCSSAVAYADFDEGDIIVKGGDHVVSCSDRDDADDNKILITHASGSADKVRDQWSTITYWTAPPREYALRRLEAH